MNADLHLPLDQIHEHYKSLRLVQPRIEKDMKASLELYGQLSPIVVCQGNHREYHLLDGFKRLRAARQIPSIEALYARLLHLSAQAAKAAILYLNWVSRKLSNIEEGWIIKSLIKDDGMSQVEIGELLSRTKSWVCRRLSLVERLSEAVQEEVRLGLVQGTIGRELARLPRGNQGLVLAAVRKHQLKSREVATLVMLLNQSSEAEQAAICRNPLHALKESAKRKHRGQDRAATEKFPGCIVMLKQIKKSYEELKDRVNIQALAKCSPQEKMLIAQEVGGARLAIHGANSLFDVMLKHLYEAQDE